MSLWCQVVLGEQREGVGCREVLGTEERGVPHSREDTEAKKQRTWR